MNKSKAGGNLAWAPIKERLDRCFCDNDRKDGREREDEMQPEVAERPQHIEYEL